MKLLGVIIAGGRSSRMAGREKAFLHLGGIALLERVASRISFQVNRVVINANGDAGRFKQFGRDVIPDQINELQTPLAGLHAALHYGAENGFDAVLTVPCDTPFLPFDLVDRLEDEGKATGAAVAVSGQRVHYLTGLWSSALAPVVDICVKDEGLIRVQDFERKVLTERVEWMTIPHDPFLNINTPEDLVAAVKLLDH